MTATPRKSKRCEATAEDANTGHTYRCVLAKGHDHTHFWQRRVGDQVLSASWYGDMAVIGRKVQCF